MSRVPEALVRGLAFERRFHDEQEIRRIFGVNCRVQYGCKKVDARDRGKYERDGIGKPANLKPDTQTKRQGFADLLLMVEHDTEKLHVIVELKSTDWDRLSKRSLQRVLREHPAQVFSYMGHLANMMWDEGTQSLVGTAKITALQAAIVYEKKPSDPDIVERVVNACGEDGIAVYWYDEFP